MLTANRLLVGLSLLLLLMSGAVVAQSPIDQSLLSGMSLGPDLLQTLGVGSRSIAMGSAFTAIADDASASFWNPARLGEIPYFQVMVEGRDLLKFDSTVSISNTTTIGTDTTDTSIASASGLTRLPFRFAFAGFVQPLGGYDEVIGAKKGTWALSYTLGGYLNYNITRNGTDTVIDTENQTSTSTTNTSHVQRKIANNFFTLAYGRNFLITRKPSVPRRATQVTQATQTTTPQTEDPLAVSNQVDNPNTDFIIDQQARTDTLKQMNEIAPGYPQSATLQDNQPYAVTVPAQANAPMPVAQPNKQTVATPKPVSDPVPVDNSPRNSRLYKVGLGVGLFDVMQSQEWEHFTQVTQDGTLLSQDSIPLLKGSGHGQGFLIGITSELWGEQSPQGDKIPLTGGHLRFGATYRSKADVSGLTVPNTPSTPIDLGMGFGREIPARITAGLAYEYTESAESVMKSAKPRAPKQFTLSAEVQHFSSANNDPSVIDNREAVTNVGFGAEYIPTFQWLPIPFFQKYTDDQTRLAYVEPIRLGIRTNNSGNVYGYFNDDVVLTGGLAVYYSPRRGGARGNYDFSLEPAAEYFTKSKQTIWTISSSYRF